VVVNSGLTVLLNSNVNVKEQKEQF